MRLTNNPPPDNLPVKLAFSSNSPEVKSSTVEEAQSGAYSYLLGPTMSDKQRLSCNWWITLYGFELGPFSEATIRECLQRGDVTSDSLCWREGFIAWLPLQQTEEFKVGKRPDPVQGSKNQTSQVTTENNVVTPQPSKSSSTQRSNVKRPGLAAGDRLSTLQTSPSARKKAHYFRRHWQGSLSLPVSYWINSIIVNLVILSLATAIGGGVWNAHPLLIPFAAVALWLLALISAVWLLVGIWRTARRYSNKHLGSAWGSLATFMTAIGLISSEYNFASFSFLPVVVFIQIISQNFAPPLYKLNIARDATELQLTGELSFGISKNVDKMLTDYPTIRVMHLTSNGGRVAEAKSLADLIIKHSLDTYVSGECDDACVTVFVAGNRRLISKEAQIGMHELYFPGMTSEDLAESRRDTEEFFYSRGVSTDVVEKGFSFDHGDLWRPKHEELFASKLATAYAADDGKVDTRIDGNSPEVTKDSLLKMPIYQAIKQKYPQEYTLIESKFTDAVLKGQSLQDIRGFSLPIIAKLYIRSMPTASYDSRATFYDTMSREAIFLYSAQGAAACEAFWKGDVRKFNADGFPQELQNAELDAGTNLILASGSQERVAIPVADLHPTIVQVVQAVGNSIGLTKEAATEALQNKLDPENNCQAAIGFFGGVVSLKGKARETVLDYLASVQ